MIGVPGGGGGGGGCRCYGCGGCRGGSESDAGVGDGVVCVGGRGVVLTSLRVIVFIHVSCDFAFLSSVPG